MAGSVQSSAVRRTFALLLVVSMLAGAWATLANTAQQAKPATSPGGGQGAAAEAAQTAPALGAEAIHDGPFTLPPAFDLGYAFGLNAGRVDIDPQRLELITAAAQYLAPHHQTHDLGPAPQTAHTFGPSLDDRHLGLGPGDKPFFLWRDPGISSDRSAYAAATALSQFLTLQGLQDQLASKLTSYSGGVTQ